MTVGLGILGAGTVGGTLVHRIVHDHDQISAKAGVDFAVRRVGVRDAAKERGFDLPEGVVTDRTFDVVEDPDVHLVVEVMGGQDPAFDLVSRALELGKPVVTANKELIAARGKELLAVAESKGVPLLFEASVGGGIPIIRPLSETLAGEPLSRVLGIVNGTTNYILTEMAGGGLGYAEALAAAQRLGYAEPDPTADVSGADAASKAAILASLAFGTWVDVGRVHREGIDGLDAADIAFAAQLGYVVKLLAVADKSDAGVCVRVHPAMLRTDHPLSGIRGATNAVFVAGPSVGELLFAGPGAGGEPTATAVLGDMIDAARELLANAQAAPRIRFAPGEVIDFAATVTKWYFRLLVADRPGVLARIAAVFGNADVSIKSVWQEGTGDEATLLIVTHRATEANQRQAAAALRELDVVEAVAATLRVVSDEE